MTEPIISIDRIESEARAAARTYDNINDACPFPFGTRAANVFKAEFNRARAVITAAQTSNAQIPAKAAAAPAAVDQAAP